MDDSYLSHILPSVKIRHNHFRSIAKALQDFQDLNATSPIYMVCDSLTSKKALPIEQLPVIFRNMAEYLNLQCVPAEAGVGLAVWSQAMQAMESLLRQVIVIMPSLTCSMLFWLTFHKFWIRII